MRCLSDVGEFGFIERLSRLIPSSPYVIEGIGDDCAILRVSDRILLVTSDMFIENVHFRRDRVLPSDIGWKAAAACLSDIAAMGGAPLYCLTSLACPPSERTGYIEDIYQGMLSAMSRFGAVIVGGDTTRTQDGITIDVTAIGETIGNRYLRRRGAKVGDHIVVTGDLGSSSAGLHALSNGVEDRELIRAHMYPNPRILEGQWLCARSEIHAMLDISDGLCQDAGHLARASRLGIDLYPERLPVTPSLARYCGEHKLDPVALMLTGGEDYELIFAMDAKRSDEVLETFHHEFRVQTTIVGSVTDAWTGVRIHGEPTTVAGHDHFKPDG